VTKIVVSIALSLTATLIAVVVARMVASHALQTDPPAASFAPEPAAAI
jgi:hypothetical protein